MLLVPMNRINKYIWRSKKQSGQKFSKCVVQLISKTFSLSNLKQFLKIYNTACYLKKNTQKTINKLTNLPICLH